MSPPPASSLPRHAPLQGWQQRDGVLLIGGMPLTHLAQRIGSTPFYAYSRERLRARVAELRQALPTGIGLHYAMKANPMPALVQFMAGLVDGIDVASAGEMQVALDAGAQPQHVSLAGPGKRDVELRQAVAAGVLVNVESPRELRVLAQAQQDLGQAARVALRVNPDFELKGSGMKMGGGPKPFGIDAEQLPAVMRDLAPMGLAFEGFHLYAGSQNLKAESICEAQQRSYELALRLAEHAPSPLRSLNLGGGFGVPYFPGEPHLRLEPIGQTLAELQQRATREMPQAQIVIELGRYLVAEAGIYVSRVIDRKVSRGHVFLVVDGGLHHHLAASGNFGQVLRKNYPVAIGTRMAPRPLEPLSGRSTDAADSADPGESPPADSSEASCDLETVSVVGPLCTPLDVLADRMALPRAGEGDLVVVFQSGAYGASASPQAFLGHPAVHEVLV
jgi:diaminopimelate decarboxylase